MIKVRDELSARERTNKNLIIFVNLPRITEHDWPSTEINFSQLAAGDKPTHIEASAIIQKFFMNFTRPA